MTDSEGTDPFGSAKASPTEDAVPILEMTERLISGKKSERRKAYRHLALACRMRLAFWSGQRFKLPEDTDPEVLMAMQSVHGFILRAISSELECQSYCDPDYSGMFIASGSIRSIGTSTLERFIADQQRIVTLSIAEMADKLAVK